MTSCHYLAWSSSNTKYAHKRTHKTQTPWTLLVFFGFSESPSEPGVRAAHEGARRGFEDGQGVVQQRHPQRGRSKEDPPPHRQRRRGYVRPGCLKRCCGTHTLHTSHRLFCLNLIIYFFLFFSTCATSFAGLCFVFSFLRVPASVDKEAKSLSIHFKLAPFLVAFVGLAAVCNLAHLYVGSFRWSGGKVLQYRRTAHRIVSLRSGNNAFLLFFLWFG